MGRIGELSRGAQTKIAMVDQLMVCRHSLYFEDVAIYPSMFFLEIPHEKCHPRIAYRCFHWPWQNVPLDSAPRVPYGPNINPSIQVPNRSAPVLRGTDRTDQASGMQRQLTPRRMYPHKLRESHAHDAATNGWRALACELLFDSPQPNGVIARACHEVGRVFRKCGACAEGCLDDLYNLSMMDGEYRGCYTYKKYLPSDQRLLATHSAVDAVMLRAPWTARLDVTAIPITPLWHA